MLRTRDIAMKWIKRLFAALALLFGAILGGGYLWLRTSLPQTDGEVRLLTEIQDLVSNPLPKDYRQIVGEDSRFGVAGDPTDLIVPEVESDTEKELGSIHHAKGTA